MSDHDLMLLALGTALGMYLMLLLQIGLEIRVGRHDRKALRAAQERLQQRTEARR